MPEQIPLMVDAATQELRQFASDETIPQGQLLAALQVALTGLVTSNTSGVLESDTILQALGKLQAQASGKVDKVAGKALSSNDFTNTERLKLAGIAEQATKNATDAALRDRSTHTGTQLASTIANFNAEVRNALPSPVQSNVDLKTLKSTGFYPILFPSDVPDANGDIGVLEVFAFSADWVVQTYHDNVVPGLSWRRNFYDGTTWSPWVPETNQITAARPIAAGGIIESGSNANGTYTKFADGTLICIGSVTTPATAFNASLIVGWNLPTAFVDANYALHHSTGRVISEGSISSAGDIVANGVVTNKGTTSCTIGAYTYKYAIVDQVVFSLTAIGRWK